MFERPASGGERAVLVHVNFPTDNKHSGDVLEFQELCCAAGLEETHLVTSSKHKPEAKFFVGSGKVEEIACLVADKDVELVIFNHELSPAQERNLEREFKCRVLSRTTLILDIFAQRALTFEGKLQVELAQLRHISTRLIRGWTHLERQKGGIGLRGPGETQLESDRRIIKEKINAIEKKLEKVNMQRELNRKGRKKGQLSTIALVGYTNAGKSTLFNTMTGADVLAEDKLFATLDPTLRGIKIPVIGEAVLADTVGFVKKLPHQLVAAFKATLQETKDADLLLHIIDASDEYREEKINKVNEVLAGIKANDIPQLYVFNKIDLTSNSTPRIEKNNNEDIEAVWLTAKSKDSVALLSKAISQKLRVNYISGILKLNPAQGEIKSMLYSHGAIQEEKIDEEGISYIRVLTLQKIWNKLCKKHSSIKEQFKEDN